MLSFETAIGEDLDLGTGTTTKSAPGGGTLPGTQINLATLGLNGAATQAATASWTPGAIAAGKSVSTTVTVTGAITSDFAFPSFDQMGANDLSIKAFVQAANVVRVVITNNSVGSITLGIGNLKVLVVRSR